MSEEHAIDFDVHQEEDRVDSHRLLWVGLTSIVTGAVGVFFAGVIVAASTGALQPSEAGPRGQRAAPRALSNVEQTPIWGTQVGLDVRDRQRRELERWGWVDRRAGIARIPIDRAMDLVATEFSR